MPQLKICSTVFGWYIRSDRMIHITKLSLSSLRPVQQVVVSPVTSANFLKPQKWQHLVYRHFMKEPNIKKNMKPNHDWDKIPRDYTMIYENHLKYWILGTQLVPMTTGLMFSSFCWIWHENINNIFSLRDKIIVLSLIGMFGLGAVYVNLIARKYVLRIYQNEGHFIAVRRTIFGRLKHLRYNLGEVTYNTKDNPHFHENCEVMIKKTKCLLFASDFISPIYYNMHLGDHSSQHQPTDFPKF